MCFCGCFIGLGFIIIIFFLELLVLSSSLMLAGASSAYWKEEAAVPSSDRPTESLKTAFPRLVFKLFSIWQYW